jgi:Lrp/AsnC family transcriptional regulator for asnA, asnC and gidA
LTAAQLDETDILLIKVLQKDSRKSLKELARLTDISVPTARARIDRLVNLGVIRQFTVAIDPQKLLGGVTAFINLKAKGAEIEAIKSALSEMDEVVGLYVTTGECDLVVKVCAQDSRMLEEFILKKLNKVAGIEGARSGVVVETAKEEYGPYIRPGFGIKVFCATCRKEIRDNPIKRVLQDVQYYFCCNTCTSTYEDFLQKKARGEQVSLAVPKHHSH